MLCGDESAVVLLLCPSTPGSQETDTDAAKLLCSDAGQGTGGARNFLTARCNLHFTNPLLFVQRSPACAKHSCQGGRVQECEV